MKRKLHFPDTYRAAKPVRAMLLASTLLAGAGTFGVQPGVAQTAALTDAQAQVLLQALASGQGGKPAALSAAQMQLLSQYFQREGQAAAASAGASAAQAQAAAQMMAMQNPAIVAASAAHARTIPLAGAQSLSPTPGGVPAESSPAPKKPGAIRIGLAEPRAQMGQGNSGANVAEPLRATFIQYLSGPAFDVIPITAMLGAQIDAEATQKECDYVLYTSVSQKVNSGGGGMFRKAMPFASMIPMVGAVGGMAGAVASSAAGAAMSGAAGLSGTVKAKSEVTLDYKLVAPGNSSPILANSVKARAKEDGEDVVSSLIEQAAGNILAELSKKK